MVRLSVPALLVPLVLLPGVALAEGSADVPMMETLLPETKIFVDILDVNERIEYRGEHPADLFDPAGVFIRTVFDGEVIEPTSGTGAYSFTFRVQQSFWGMEVAGRQGGRVWSADWRFNAGEFSQRRSVTRSFYALVDGGQPGHDGVVEMKAEGLGGYVFRLAANTSGLRGADGRSVPYIGQVSDAQVPVYFEPPERALLNPVAPQITGASSDSVFSTCETLVPGSNEVTFTFESNVSGTLHLICDLNQDGTFDMVGDGDVHLIREAVQGTNAVTWAGTDTDGVAVPVGTYECLLRLTQGEFHYVAHDIETSYPGFRLFEYQQGAQRRGLSMYWNDVEVQANDISMENGVPGIVTSGPTGVASGAYDAPADPLVNARAWGRFRPGSKGDNAWLDTYVWLGLDDSDVFTVNIADGIIDTDQDGLTDIEEDCETGTDKTKPDTDDDGIGDKKEVRRMPTDPLDPDSDDDCVLDGAELNANGDLVDSDGDDLPDPLDPDDDNDGISTLLEMCELTTDQNYDRDLFPNNLDLDSDADQYSDTREGYCDRDGDGNPDFLDRDTIGLGQCDPDAGFYAGGCRSVDTRPGVALLLLAAGALRRRRPSLSGHGA